MNRENNNKLCYVALSDVMNVDRVHQNEVERYQLKPCCVQLKRLEEDGDMVLDSSKTIENELVTKFSLKPCVVRLTDLNCRVSDANLSAASVIIDGELSLTESSDQNESALAISSPIESSSPLAIIIIYDRTSQCAMRTLTRDAYGDFYLQNTQFAIDDFKSTANHHFLTRFHPNQYADLTKEFDRFIYASKITAYLVRKILRVHGSLVRILNPDLPIIVDDVQITAITVPSYPGAIMIMFKTTTGRVEIHGNYMHTSAELEENSTIWNNAHIDALVIHNNPTVMTDTRWPQDECLFRNKMSRIIDRHMETQRRRGLVGLIVFNAHRNMYSMEKFYVSLAQLYELSIWVDHKIKHLFNALDIEDLSCSKVFTKNPANAGIHILSDEKFDKDNLLEYLGHLDTVHHIIAFRTCAVVNVNESFLPSYNRFPLFIYNVPNPFVANIAEYLRFVRFLGVAE